ncbi:MAG TPA: cation:proton antiporter [Spirochaetota bacterium]|nr:cation:proton antiporter [Spirochaetota bacterium]OPZ39574.1 MAG: Inner membrane protein YbaL [Spirochaetes bacterium ADurb.BinA120]HNU91049.1 cation:proton antiporter [Spirochaetota bacterium]HPI13273.1 cation:proton antiporter [Spirochaetota bacterium]HPV98363.1 cation:proton antiporter [Spirochaetota bacterium]
MSEPLLSNMVVVFALAVVSLFVCIRLKIPTIVGLLLVGVLAGPSGLGLINVSKEVEAIADIGVVLLLFTIGLEFSLKKLLRARRTVLLGGSLQVLITTATVYFAAVCAGISGAESLFAGFIISMSSTAIAMRLLEERGEIDGPAGVSSLAISLFQDIMSVPMVLSIPLLMGIEGNAGSHLGVFFLKTSAIIVLVLLGARWLVPQVLYQVTRTRSRELFLLSVLGLCGAIAWLTSRVDLSLALGAFLAGLIISESEYSHQALGSILPFRDVFTGFFFISVGMLLDVNYFLQHPFSIGSLALGVVILKIIIILAACTLIGLPLSTGIMTGFAISNIGEFSFVLIRAGSSSGLLSDETSQFFLAVTVISMILAPFLMGASNRVTGFIGRLPLPDKLRAGLFSLSGIEFPSTFEEGKSHIIIVGYGINGRNVARAASIAGIPYIIIEMNPDTVRREQRNGEHIIFGNADQEAVLAHAGITAARVIVIAIADPAATRQVTAVARKANQDIYIIARTRYVQEVQPLFRLGANEVIPEEFETSVEIFTRVLRKYLVPLDEIRRFVGEIRSGGYELLRDMRDGARSCGDLSCYLAGEDVAALKVSGASAFAGKSLAEINMRRSYEVAVVAVRRGASIISNPDGDTRILAGDILVAFGQPDRVEALAGLLNPEK